MFCYVWEFSVRPEFVEAFREAYGPGGDWVKLFRRDWAYIRTELLADSSDPTRFVTLDYWTSRAACSAFRERFQAEFEALDLRCASFTTRETHLGDFDVLVDE